MFTTVIKALVVNAALFGSHISIVAGAATLNPHASLDPRMVGPNPISRARLWAGDVGPVVADVVQGTVGDCWLAATMASIVLVDADVIKSIMVPLDHNNKASDRVTVTLWDYVQKKQFTATITLAQANEASNSFVINPLKPGAIYVWALMLALAVQQLGESNSNLGIGSTLDGGFPENAFQAIDGLGSVTTARVLSDLSDGNLWALLGPVKDKASVADTKSDSSGYLKPIWLPSSHSYTIMDSDPTEKTVTLRNPWGMISQNSLGGASNGGTGVTDLGDGVFRITFEDFRANYYSIEQYGAPPNYPSKLVAGSLAP